MIATAGGTRSTFVDGVPTLKQAGVDLEVPLWFAVYAPAATPPALLDPMRQAIHAKLAMPEAKAQLARLGLVPAPSGSAELLVVQRRESDMWVPVVQASGFTPAD